MAKQIENYETAERKGGETSEFEQKPLLNFNEFDDEEEKEIKQQQHEKNKKKENHKEKEKRIWEKLGELNKTFKDIKQRERVEDKKMSATIL